MEEEGLGRFLAEPLGNGLIEEGQVLHAADRLGHGIDPIEIAAQGGEAGRRLAQSGGMIDEILQPGRIAHEIGTEVQTLDALALRDTNTKNK